MPLFELELRRAGFVDDERLYDGESLGVGVDVAIDDSIWRVIERTPPVSPITNGRLVLSWTAWRRSEVARARAVRLVSDSTALMNEAQQVLRQARRRRAT